MGLGQLERRIVNVHQRPQRDRRTVRVRDGLALPAAVDGVHRLVEAGVEFVSVDRAGDARRAVALQPLLKRLQIAVEGILRRFAFQVARLDLTEAGEYDDW